VAVGADDLLQVLQQAILLAVALLGLGPHHGDLLHL
jgi:hypothetical protein